MRNQIVLKRYKTQNCVENCISNLCDHNNIDFSPLFFYSWDFGFRVEPIMLEDRLHYNSRFDYGIDKYFEIAKAHLGILFMPICCKINTIMSLLTSGKTLLVEADGYYLPWNLAFEKYHIIHDFVIEYNITRKTISVCDSFCSDTIVDLDDIKDINITKGYLVQLIDRKLNLDEYVLLRKNYLSFLKKNRINDVYNSIKLFGEALERIDSVETLTAYTDDLSNSLFVRKINHIVNARYNTQYLFGFFDFSKYHKEIMNDIYMKWEAVKGMFIKTLISKKTNLFSQLSHELFVLSDLECDLCDSIIRNEIEQK